MAKLDKSTNRISLLWHMLKISEYLCPQIIDRLCVYIRMYYLDQMRNGDVSFAGIPLLTGTVFHLVRTFRIPESIITKLLQRIQQ